MKLIVFVKPESHKNRGRPYSGIQPGSSSPVANTVWSPNIMIHGEIYDFPFRVFFEGARVFLRCWYLSTGNTVMLIFFNQVLQTPAEYIRSYIIDQNLSLSELQNSPVLWLPGKVLNSRRLDLFSILVHSGIQKRFFWILILRCWKLDTWKTTTSLLSQVLVLKYQLHRNSFFSFSGVGTWLPVAP